MNSCYCPSCKSVEDYHAHENQAAKMAGVVVGASTKLAGWTVDQTQYEDDKSKGKPITAELNLIKNKQVTNQFTNASSKFAEAMAGGRFELRCNTCSEIIEYPQAQSFEHYKTMAKAGFAHKNRWYMTAVGFFAGAVLALALGTFGANGSYVFFVVCGAIVGHFSSRFLSAKVNSLLNIVFSSAKLFYAFCFGGVVVGAISPMFGKIGFVICGIGYTALGLLGIYSMIKDEVKKRKEIFSEDTEQKKKIDKHVA